MSVNPHHLEAAYQTALAALLAERTPEGYWVGELSTSALSTATAVGALSLILRQGGHDSSLITLRDRGLHWLIDHQNPDGGWGDTDRSLSNISTTMLCRAAFHLAAMGDRPSALGQSSEACLERAAAYLDQQCGPGASNHAEGIRQRYGKDRTFSVPILMTAALAGLVSWDEVPPLPFELACFPQSWFRFLRLPVVSYALPALIAIGQAIYHHRPPRNPITYVIRGLASERSLRVLERIQPSSGGFLEAVPLTSFVVMSLASIGRADHPVARKGVEFLLNCVRPDGSWPIDSNLSVWVTTLSINALATTRELARLGSEELIKLHAWLLQQQFKERHPYTGADPGGWGWTHLPGSVPDGDDTPGALLALHHLNVPASARSALDASVWLVDLQNRDDGWPTFCRGWGNLPFDRSGPDLTAHSLRALKAWVLDLPQPRASFWRLDIDTLEDNMPDAMHDAIKAGLKYLAKTQRPDGSWLPLWFGNQQAPNEENPTYGTARVLAAYRDLSMMDSEPARKGVAWLLAAQNADGGWGGAAGVTSSVEESALAVEVLLDVPAASGGRQPPEVEAAVRRGLHWLIAAVEAGRLKSPEPIGFYFAKLWYYEKLYPIVFAVAALGRARLKLSNRRATDSPMTNSP